MLEELGYIHYSCKYRPMAGVFEAFKRHWSSLSAIPVFDGGAGESVIRSVQSPECRAWVAMLTRKEERALAAKLSIPVVNYSNYHGPSAEAINVFFDEHEIGRLAAESFLSKGHTHFVVATYENIAFSTERSEAFQARLREAGKSASPWTLDPDLRENPLRFELERRKLFKRWFEKLELPAAVFCVNDSVAAHVTRMAEMHFGERAWLLSMAGVDDTAASEGLPQLSSLRPNYTGVGEALAETLRAALKDGRWENGNVCRIGGARWIERESTWGGPGGRSPLVTRCVRQIEKMLEKDESPSVSSLAGALGVSRRTLLSHFRDSTGNTLRDYLIEARIKRAAKLLQETDRSIADIAFATGFSKQSNLSFRFRQVYGMSPRDFRQSSKATDA
ncbi:MAG: helix-turn-helix domain-containing protein [Opitutales bacterium]|nr:helix-turn-helix domain-containing protein [Opitutales bacterium]